MLSFAAPPSPSFRGSESDCLDSTLDWPEEKPQEANPRQTSPSAASSSPRKQDEGQESGSDDETYTDQELLEWIRRENKVNHKPNDSGTLADASGRPENPPELVPARPHRRSPRRERRPQRARM
ncbi:hypothetical protein V5O48_006438 [Marasmius crinis-equi]|uniref:Uncharacterized protein n=1 Tax=Marasmius crinis-equi TaxID=585013 RepID=A0ABR3FKE3_9AGAR